MFPKIFPGKHPFLILHLIQSTLFHNLSEPVKALFLYSFLGLVIHVYKAKLVFIAGSPLKIIKQGPHKIAGKRNALLHCLVCHFQMGVDIVDTGLIQDLAVSIRMFLIACSILCNINF